MVLQMKVNSGIMDILALHFTKYQWVLGFLYGVEQAEIDSIDG